MPAQKKISADLFFTLAEDSDQIILGINKDQKIVYQNKKGAHFLQKELRATSDVFTDLLYKKDLSRWKICSKKTQTCSIDFRFDVNHKFYSVEGEFIPAKDRSMIGFLRIYVVANDLMRKKSSLLAKSDEIKSLLEATDILMYRVVLQNSKAREIEFLSKNTNQLFGISYDNYMRLFKAGKLLSYFHPDDRAKIVEANHRLKKEKTPVKERYRFKNPKTRKYIWLEESSFPILDKKRNIVEIIGVTRNIDHQVEREIRIQESEQRFRSMVEKNLAGFYRLNTKNILVEVNDAFARIFGFKSKLEVIGKNVNQIYKKSTDQNIFIDRLRKRKRLINHESEIILKNGTLKSILENTSIFKELSTNEEFIEGTLIDITPLKQAEELMKENERKYKSLFENNLAGVFRTTLDGRILEFNAAFMRIFGYKNRKELEMTRSEDLYFSKSDREKYLKSLRRKGSLKNYELRHKRNDGMQVIVLANVSLEKGKNSKEQFIQGTLVDITDLREMNRKLVENADRYKNLYENASDAILILKDDVVVDCNKEATELFQCSRSIMKKCDITAMTSKDQDDILQNVQSKFHSHKRINRFNWVFRNKNGKNIYAEVITARIPIDGVEHVQCIIRNVTHRVMREKELQLEIQNYQELIEHSPDGNIILDNGKMVYVNPSAVHILGYNHSKELVGKKAEMIIPKRSQKEIQKLLDLAQKKKSQTRFYEYKLSGKSKEEIDTGIQVVPVKYEGKDCLNIIMYDLGIKKQLLQQQTRAQIAEASNVRLQKEIEEHKITQQKLAEQVGYVRSVFDSAANVIIFTVNKDLEITSWNNTLVKVNKEYFGFDASKVKKYFDHLKKFMDQAAIDELEINVEKAFNGESVFIEGPLTTTRGQQVWFETFINPVRITGTNRIEEVAIISSEVTERKLRNKQLKDSLHEKEILLKEVHHRVKNNLQIISSILNLQSTFNNDAAVNSILRESQNRIKSMSFIHESLYQNKDFSSINLSEYILNLSRNLVHTYHVGEHMVDLKLDLKDVTLPLDQAIPCGLVLNEVITNSLKYAFPDGKPGRIYVGVSEQKGDVLKITVSDNGKGLPEGFDIAKTPTLGLQLVNSLAEQLDAELNLQSSSKGVEFQLSFKKQEI